MDNILPAQYNLVCLQYCTLVVVDCVSNFRPVSSSPSDYKHTKMALVERDFGLGEQFRTSIGLTLCMFQENRMVLLATSLDKSRFDEISLIRYKDRSRTTVSTRKKIPTINTEIRSNGRERKNQWPTYLQMTSSI